MIRLDKVHRDFKVGDQVVHALDDVNLEIERGEYLSVMGPSGSGKSTLLNLIGLLDHATSGRYLLEGRDVVEMGESDEAHARNRYIGFVFQSFHLIPRLTAEENVALPLVLAGIDPPARQRRVAESLERMGLRDRAHHKPDQLSGGERQRVAIARATITEPVVLLADEPTGNLDRHSGGEVVDLLEELNRRDITLIVVTHDPALGERANRRIRMVDGRIEFDRRAG